MRWNFGRSALGNIVHAGVFEQTLNPELLAALSTRKTLLNKNDAVTAPYSTEDFFQAGLFIGEDPKNYFKELARGRSFELLAEKLAAAPKAQSATAGRFGSVGKGFKKRQCRGVARGKGGSSGGGGDDSGMKTPGPGACETSFLWDLLLSSGVVFLFYGVVSVRKGRAEAKKTTAYNKLKQRGRLAGFGRNGSGTTFETPLRSNNDPPGSGTLSETPRETWERGMTRTPAVQTPAPTPAPFTTTTPAPGSYGATPKTPWSTAGNKGPAERSNGAIRPRGNSGLVTPSPSHPRVGGGAAQLNAPSPVSTSAAAPVRAVVPPSDPQNSFSFAAGGGSAGCGVLPVTTARGPPVTGGGPQQLVEGGGGRVPEITPGGSEREVFGSARSQQSAWKDR